MRSTSAVSLRGLFRTQVQLRFHTPSIKFRHVKGSPQSQLASGVSSAARAALPEPVVAAAAPSPASPAVHTSYKQFLLQPSKASKQFYDLPEMYGRPSISAEEADAILAGARF
jgi:hypothetical protein